MHEQIIFLTIDKTSHWCLDIHAPLLPQCRGDGPCEDWVHPTVEGPCKQHEGLVEEHTMPGGGVESNETQCAEEDTKAGPFEGLVM